MGGGAARSRGRITSVGRLAFALKNADGCRGRLLEALLIGLRIAPKASCGLASVLGWQQQSGGCQRLLQDAASMPHIPRVLLQEGLEAGMVAEGVIDWIDAK